MLYVWGRLIPNECAIASGCRKSPWANVEPSGSTEWAKRPWPLNRVDDLDHGLQGKGLQSDQCR